MVLLVVILYCRLRTPTANGIDATQAAKVIPRVQRTARYSTVSAIRNGAVSLIAETKSNVVIFTPGRGLSRVFR